VRLLALVLVGFITHSATGLQPASIAMAGAVFLLLLETYNHGPEDQHHKVQSAIAESEWVTLMFFVGLFVLVHGLVQVGVIGMLADYLLHATGGNIQLTGYTLLWGSAVLSALVDNIPYVATMIPLLQQMAPGMGTPVQTEVLWWMLAAGACLGGNGSLIGASANVVVAGLAAKQGITMAFFKFLVVAFPMMLLSIAVAHVYFWLRYF
jgi:Na+/H+ antiporter NhaD/arsenite permease-like protein